MKGSQTAPTRIPVAAAGGGAANSNNNDNDDQNKEEGVMLSVVIQAAHVMGTLIDGLKDHLV